MEQLAIVLEEWLGAGSSTRTALDGNQGFVGDLWSDRSNEIASGREVAADKRDREVIHLREVGEERCCRRWVNLSEDHVGMRVYNVEDFRAIGCCSWLNGFLVDDLPAVFRVRM